MNQLEYGFIRRFKVVSDVVVSLADRVRVVYLSKRYGGENNIPHKELKGIISRRLAQQEYRKNVLHVEQAFETICERFHLEPRCCVFYKRYSDFAAGRTESVDEYNHLRRLTDLPNKNRAVYTELQRLGDLHKGRINTTLASPEARAEWEAWLSKE